MIPVRIGDVSIGNGPLVLIAGPCVIESEAHVLELATAVRDIARAANVPAVFKASYDKANRTSSRSFRGPGLVEGLRILGRVRDTVGIPIHWGFTGVAKTGFLANSLTPAVGDGNSQTPEFKSFLVNVEKA